MFWDVEFTDEFGNWWETLDAGEQDSIDVVVRLLQAFDPRRIAILLIGGKKARQDRWYAESIPKADNLYEAHLRELDLED